MARSGGLVDDLGAIGILYLMFLAGLSFDIKAFNDNRRMAITFGLLGFFIPFFLSVFVVDQAEDIETLGALLIGAMWASNTLVAYSEVQSAGSAEHQVGRRSGFCRCRRRSDVADRPGLRHGDRGHRDRTRSTCRSAATSPSGSCPKGSSRRRPTRRCRSGSVCRCWSSYVCGCCRGWRTGSSCGSAGPAPNASCSRLALMAVGATVALLGGMEGLIGAFLAGLGLNRLIPARGPLMERLDFVGTSLFIPVFLISIGLNIDPAVLIDPADDRAGVAVHRLRARRQDRRRPDRREDLRSCPRNEVGLMASLSFGQAASTLAIAQVGLSLGMFEQNVVNSAVLAIVITAFITSYATRFFASRVPPVVVDRPPIGQQVLLDARGSASDISALVAFAGGLARPDGGLVIPYGVAGDAIDPTFARQLTAPTAEAPPIGLDGDGMVRVGDSFANATVNLVAELDASLVLLAWDGPKWAADYMFGNDIDGIGQASPVPTIAAHLVRPWDRIVVQLGRPRTAWQREDVELTADVVRHLCEGTDVQLVVLCDDDSTAALLEHDGDRDSERMTVITDRAQHDDVINRVEPTDLMIVPAHIVHDMPPWRLRRLVRRLHDTNLAVVGGPHRLTVSQGVTPRPLSTAITPRLTAV